MQRRSYGWQQDISKNERPVIAKRGEKGDIEIRKGQHNKKSRSEKGWKRTVTYWREKGGERVSDDSKLRRVSWYEHFAQAGGYSNSKETKWSREWEYETRYR